MTPDFEIRQSYDLKQIYLKDNTTYDIDRTNDVTGVRIQLWPWIDGPDVEDPDTYIYDILNTDPDWTTVWQSIRNGAFFNTTNWTMGGQELGKIDDNSYNIRVIIFHGELQSQTFDVYGFYQEVQNGVTQLTLNTDWKETFIRSDKTSNELVTVLSVFNALKLSIDPASLIANYNRLLNSLRRMLDIQIPE